MEDNSQQLLLRLKLLEETVQSLARGFGALTIMVDEGHDKQNHINATEHHTMQVVIHTLIQQGVVTQELLKATHEKITDEIREEMKAREATTNQGNGTGQPAEEARGGDAGTPRVREFPRKGVRETPDTDGSH